MMPEVEVDRKGLNDHCIDEEATQKGQRAHEHYRTRQEISPVTARVSQSHAMGLETMSPLWEYGYDQAWDIFTPSLVFRWTGGSEGAATQM
jgi:hypothetical protein